MRGWTIYCPKYRKQTIHNRTKKKLLKTFPLITGYLFIQSGEENLRWDIITDFIGVHGPLRTKGKEALPQPLPGPKDELSATDLRGKIPAKEGVVERLMRLENEGAFANVVEPSITDITIFSKSKRVHIELFGEQVEAIVEKYENGVVKARGTWGGKPFTIARDAEEFRAV